MPDTLTQDLHSVRLAFFSVFCVGASSGYHRAPGLLGVLLPKRVKSSIQEGEGRIIPLPYELLMQRFDIKRAKKAQDVFCVNLA